MRPWFTLLLFGWAWACAAQVAEPIRLWLEKAPGAMGEADQDIPTVIPYLPPRERATGAAIVICPGGGYAVLAAHEGDHYARWLNELGVAAFVLKYRLGSSGYRHPVMLQDAARAVRLVRARAGQWGLDPRRVGIMGSSAGGHLASTLLTHFDPGRPEASDPVERESSRPDLGILCYPVISLSAPFAHRGSRENLLGKDAPEELARALSNENNVTSNTPPCFLWHTWEDRGVPIENSLAFARALREAGVPFELHVFEHGGHGLGLGTREWAPEKRHPWTVACAHWLRQRGFAR